MSFYWVGRWDRIDELLNVALVYTDWWEGRGTDQKSRLILRNESPIQPGTIQTIQI